MSLITRTHPRFLMLALTAALSLGASAQTPPPVPQGTQPGTHGPSHHVSRDSHQAGMPRHGMHQGMAERRSERMAWGLEKRQQRQTQALTSLAQALQLQPGQQAAWQRFEQAMQARLKMHANPPVSDPAVQDLPARVAQLKARKAERDAAFEQGLQATLDLHATLDARQQAVLNTQAGRWLQPRGAGHHGKGMGPRHGRHAGGHHRHQPA